jgi:hypothetical protein
MRDPYIDLKVEIHQSPIKPNNPFIQKPTIKQPTDKFAAN